MAGPTMAREPERAAPDRAPAIQSAIFGFTAAPVCAPILVIAFQSLQSAPLYEIGRTWTLDGYFRLFGHAEFREAVGNSLGLAAVSTIVATLVGVASAIAIVRFDVPGR